MLKDISGHHDDAEFADTNEDARPQVPDEGGQANREREGARFRASLWLSLAADARRRA